MQDLNHYLSDFKKHRDLPSDLKLERVRNFLKALGDPHEYLPPVIHVAGTNGKGSTIAFLKSIFKAAGYKPHVYTSPHLLHIRERFVVGGEEVSDDLLLKTFQEGEKALGNLPITWFEFLTASAFKLFADAPADVVLLETGMGGRLDATNAIKSPALTLITSISYDHQKCLGTTLAEIASEKAGIFKPHRPALIGRQKSDEVLQAFKKRADALHSPLFYEGKHWSVEAHHQGEFSLSFSGLPEEMLLLPAPSLKGSHQIDNASLAVAATKALKDVFFIPDEAIKQGLLQAHWPGRLQRLERHPLRQVLGYRELWVDGAHNEAGISALVHFFQEMPPKPTFIVFSCLEDKDGEKMVKTLESLAERIFFTEIKGTEKVYPACELQKFTDKGLSFPALRDCLSTLKEIPQGARIIFCGSLYFTADVLGFSEVIGEKGR